MEVSLEVEQLADNATIQLGEESEATGYKYKLTRDGIDSTLMLYLNITDENVSSQTIAKLSLKYKGEVISTQTVNFNYIKWAEGTNPYTVRVNNQLCEKMSAETMDTITTLTVGGRISGKDIVFMRDSLSLKVLDLGQAKITESSALYFGDYTCETDIIGVRMFYGTELSTIILPSTAKKISNYALYQNTKLTKAVIGNEVTEIGSYAFSGCTALERITFPASIADIGRNAFKSCPIVCVICEGETPAKLGSKVFDGADLAAATLVVPNEAAIATYKAQKQWKDFGTIITYDQYLTAIAPVTEDAEVAVKDGKIIVSSDAEVTIYTFAGKQVAAGKAGEYALPAGNYIVKTGKKANKVRL